MQSREEKNRIDYKSENGRVEEHQDQEGAAKQNIRNISKKRTRKEMIRTKMRIETTTEERTAKCHRTEHLRTDQKN